MLLSLCPTMINFKFYFRTTKFDIDKASLNLEKLILQKLLKAKHKFQSLFLKDFAIEIWAKSKVVIATKVTS